MSSVQLALTSVCVKGWDESEADVTETDVNGAVEDAHCTFDEMCGLLSRGRKLRPRGSEKEPRRLP